MGYVNEAGYSREEAKQSVGKGWGNLIDILFDAKPEETRVAQVKEKFGGLRFYVDNADKDYRALVSKIEGLSYSICENCGKLGETSSRGRGWIKTQCKECQPVKE